jgi:hypothetical protein
MIKVNLLPPEYRPKEHTPLPMLAGIIGGVTFTALVLVGFLYIHLQKLTEVNASLQRVELTRDGLRKEAQKHDQLQARKADLEKLGNAVRSLDSSKVRWSRPVDDLAWIIHDADKGMDVKSWITSLDFDSSKAASVPRPGETPGGGKLDFNVEVQGGEMDRMGTFRDQVKKKDRWLGANLLSLNPPVITVKEYGEYIPPVAGGAKIVITLKPKEPPKPAAPAAPAAPAGGKPADEQKKGN